MDIENADTNAMKKYEQLQKRVQEMEQHKFDIQSKLIKAQKHVKRLRMERLILLEQLDDYFIGDRGPLHSSDSGGSDTSDTEAIPYEIRMKQFKRKRHRLMDKSISSNKKSSSKLQDSSMAGPTRKKKDPNAPKGPGNVFFLYCRMEREHFKDELPTENLGEVTRLLGQKWKAMTDDEKKKYYDIYDKEQEEYQKAMKSYKEAGGGDAGRTAVSEMIKNDSGNYGDVDMIQDGLDVNNDDEPLDDDDDDDDDNDDVDHDVHVIDVDDDDADADDVDDVDDDDDDDEGSGLFMDEDRTIMTNIATNTTTTTISPDINSNMMSVTEPTHTWYAN